MSCRTKAILLLGVVVLLAGWGRWYSASHVFDPKHNPDKALFFDEVVYIALGQNLMNRGDYSLRMQYPNMKKFYSKIPNYVNDPLFKHPPLVPLLVGLNLKAVSNNIRGAFFPGVVLGTAMLVLMFLLARNLFADYRVTWLAVLLLAVSPTHWICSARIILEAPLACFILAAVTAQLCRCRRAGAWASAAWALAWWTKYTAIPIWALFQALMLVAYPRLVRDRSYWLSQAAILALYIPWIVWRISVDGAGLFLFWRSSTEEWQAAAALLSRPALWAAAILVGASVCWLIRRRKQVLSGLMRLRRPGAPAIAWSLLAGVVLILCLEPAAFSFSELPWAGERDNLLRNGPVWTYFLRMFWFEPITLVGMASVFFLPGPRRVQVIKALALGGSLALTAWGNYQMRYFLPMIPFWEVLSAGALVYLYGKIRVHSAPAAAAFAGCWIAWSVARSGWLVWKIAIPNDVFYY